MRWWVTPDESTNFDDLAASLDLHNLRHDHHESRSLHDRIDHADFGGGSSFGDDRRLDRTGSGHGLFFGRRGNIATGLTWSLWNQTEAVGHGTRDELGCVPSCAQGTVTPYPVTLTLTDPVNGSFTSLLEQTADGKGTTEAFTAPALGQGACTTSDESSCKFSSP